MTVTRLLWVVVLGWLLRFVPLLWGAQVFADEGVYYAASAWIWEGRWPYADFVLVHPPGIVWLLAPVSWLEPANGFFAARVLTTLVGAVNILLVGRIAGVPGALCYALWPEAVALERGPALEPWLNCALLGMLNTRGWVSGALGGLALTIKLWAVPWFAILLVRKDWRALVAVPVVFAVLVAPFDTAALVDQVFGFQIERPADGAGRWTRLGALLHPQHLLFTAMGVYAALRFRPLLAIPWVLTWVAFLAAPGFWNRYTVFLALATAVIAVPVHRIHLAAATMVAFAFSLWQTRYTDPPVPAGAMGLDSAVTLRANRLPPIPDLYATMLRAGGSIDDPRAQEVVVGLLSDEPVLHIRDEDREWLTPESEALLGLEGAP